jgi:hypothetical protein
LLAALLLAAAQGSYTLTGQEAGFDFSGAVLQIYIVNVLANMFPNINVSTNLTPNRDVRANPSPDDEVKIG